MGIAEFFKLFVKGVVRESIVEGHIPNDIYGISIDCNGLIHRVAAQVFGYGTKLDGSPLTVQEKAIIRNKFQNDYASLETEFLDKIDSTLTHVFINILRPSHYLILTIDGVAPFAKINQQRSRRFGTVQDNLNLQKRWQESDAISAYNTSNSLKSRKEIEKEKRVREDIVQDRPILLFDTASITAGTPLMEKVNKTIKLWFTKNKSKLPPYFLYSSHEVPGEGEHKIFALLKDLEKKIIEDSEGKINHEIFKEQIHAIYGKDSDLCFLSAIQDYNFIWIRESSDRYPYSMFRLDAYVSIETIRNFIIYRMTNKDPDQFSTSEKHFYMLDFILLGFLIGDDFVPAVPTLDLNNGHTLVTIMETYRLTFDKIAETYGQRYWIVQANGQISWQLFKFFIDAFYPYENVFYSYRKLIQSEEAEISNSIKDILITYQYFLTSQGHTNDVLNEIINDNDFIQQSEVNYQLENIIDSYTPYSQGSSSEDGNDYFLEIQKIEKILPQKSGLENIRKENGKKGTYTPSPLYNYDYDDFCKEWVEIIISPSLLLDYYPSKFVINNQRSPVNQLTLAYRNKCYQFISNYQNDDLDFIVSDYLNGLQWNLAYYLGYSINNWYYKQSLAPCIKHIYTYLSRNPNPNFTINDVIRQPNDLVIVPPKQLFMALYYPFSEKLIESCKLFNVNNKPHIKEIYQTFSIYFPLSFPEFFYGKYNSAKHTKNIILSRLDLDKIFTIKSSASKSGNIYLYIDSEEVRKLNSSIGNTSFARKNETRFIESKEEIRELTEQNGQNEDVRTFHTRLQDNKREKNRTGQPVRKNRYLEMQELNQEGSSTASARPPQTARPTQTTRPPATNQTARPTQTARPPATNQTARPPQTTRPAQSTARSVSTAVNNSPFKITQSTNLFVRKEKKKQENNINNVTNNDNFDLL